MLDRALGIEPVPRRKRPDATSEAFILIYSDLLTKRVQTLPCLHRLVQQSKSYTMRNQLKIKRKNKKIQSQPALISPNQKLQAVKNQGVMKVNKKFLLLRLRI